MAPPRRKSSMKFHTPTGVWSVRINGTFVKEGVTETEAWKTFLTTSDPGQLLRGGTIMSERTAKSPILTRQVS